MADAPDFDDAAVWVIWPAHLSDEQLGAARQALERALPDEVPVISAIRAEEETPGSRNPILWSLGGYVAKEAIKGSIAVIKDQYKADKAAQKSYDDRAERYNRERDNYFGRR